MYIFGVKRISQSVQTELERQLVTCLSPFFHDAMQIVPHRLVADALATFCQEKCGVGLRIGEVRADALFIDAHGRLSKRGENGLAYPFARALGALAMPRLDAIMLVKEVTVSSEGIQMKNFISPQATFPCHDDHGVVTRGGQLLLIVVDVLQADEVVE